MECKMIEFENYRVNLEFYKALLKYLKWQKESCGIILNLQQEKEDLTEMEQHIEKEYFSKMCLEIDHTIYEIWKKREKIITWINAIADDRIRNVMIAYYINGKTAEKIAEEMFFTFQHIGRMKRAGVLHILLGLIKNKEIKTMIVYENKGFETRSDKPNEDWTGKAKYIVQDGSPLANKILEAFPYYDFVEDTIKNARGMPILIDVIKRSEPLEIQVEKKIESIRQDRKGYLEAFDVYKSNLDYGIITETEEEHVEVMNWYMQWLELPGTVTKEKIKTIVYPQTPKKIEKYLETTNM